MNKPVFTPEVIEKVARHAMDRLKERTDLNPSVVFKLDRFANKLTKDGIPAGKYYLPLPDNKGYAAFKTVKKNKLVLATILGPGMKPKGTSLSHVPHEKLAKYMRNGIAIDPNDDENTVAVKKRFNELSSLLGRRGVYSGTAHKRITIPKEKLTEDDIGTLGFKKVLIAIPEAGQDRFVSWRHPDNTYHIHSHDDRWTMHKDRHPAATMIAHSEGRLKSMLKGAPHVVTEGIPGMYYYLKGKALGRASTADQVSDDLAPDVRELLAGLPPSPTWAPTEMKTADEPENDDTRNALMAGAVAAPWAGTIGQPKAVHANQGQLVGSQAELRKMLRPGDVILSGEPGMGEFKGFIGATSGNPKGYHTGVVDRRGRVIEAHPGYGVHRGSFNYMTPADDHLQVLRPNFNKAEMAEHLNNLDNHVKVTQRYRRDLGGALRAEGVKGQANKDMVYQAAGGAYDLKGGIGAGLKETFLPKMTSDAAIETERAASQKAVADYIRNGHPSNARSAARHAIRMSSMPTKIREANLYYNNRVDRLVSSVCSTVPALSMPAGKAVVPGKLPSQVLPADYLRSQHYTPVARFSANPTALHEKILGHGPTLTRLGAGALGAGAVYGIDHWLKNRKKNRPAYTGEQNG